MNATSSASHSQDPSPAITVIIQTFDRSNILGYVVDSVLAQTRTDWELLVIGDACTDDTASVVAGYRDPRIRFVNLERRVGDQSGPTNEGVRQARGQFIALLNHDDFYFPDHLAATTETLARTGADFTFSLQLEADPDGSWRVNSPHPSPTFDPMLHPNASTWVFRRDVFARIGPLRGRRDVYTYPTRDWLWRAYRQGVKFAPTPAVTVLVVSATTRSNVYTERQSSEHAAIARALRDDLQFREQRLFDAWQHPRPTHLRAYRSRDLWKALVMRALGRLALMIGVDPEAVYCYHRFPRKWGLLPTRGAVIRELYRRRGLDETT